MTDEDVTIKKDTSYSPSSGDESEQRQQERPEGNAALNDPEINSDAIRQAPGVGGPDDAGDIEAGPDELGDIDEVLRRGQQNKAGNP